MAWHPIQIVLLPCLPCRPAQTAGSSVLPLKKSGWKMADVTSKFLALPLKYLVVRLLVGKTISDDIATLIILQGNKRVFKS